MSKLAVKLQDILDLPELAELKVVAGSAGLNRIVFWSHIVEMPDVAEWVHAGDLLFTTGIGIHTDVSQLSHSVQECHAKGVAGLIINTGPYISQTPDFILALADELDFPVLEIPWKVRLSEVIRVIYNFIVMKQFGDTVLQEILESILYSNAANYHNLIARAASYDYDLIQPQQIMVVKLDNLDSYLRESAVLTEQQVRVHKLQIQNTIRSVFDSHNKKILMMLRLDKAIIMLPTLATHEEQSRTRKIAEELSRDFKTRYAELNLFIGWGNPYETIAGAPKGLSQAEQAMKVAQTVMGHHRFSAFDDLGFYKVLFNVKDREELENFRSEVLKNLLAYDQKHNAQLVETLTVFLEENENFTSVSERLFIHRNTLKYRLQKIADISGRNLADPKDRMLLYFATTVHRFLAISHDNIHSGR